MDSRARPMASSEASPATSDSESDSDDDSGHATHHLRGRPPLLPPRMATLVSTVSGATRLSLEITSLFWEAVFETISDSTSGGRSLGTAAWQEAKAATLAVAGVLTPLSSLNPRIVSNIVGSTTAAGYSLFNRSLAATESLVEGGFALSAKAVGLGLHAAGEYVRFIDAVFGSTDTSRVLASFVHMVRRETLDNNPEIRALIKEHGLVSFVSQVLKTLVAWTCLQVVTHGRERPYRMDLVYSNMHPGAAFCPRRYVTATGAPLLSHTPPPRSPASTPRQASPIIFHADRLRARLATHAAAAAASAELPSPMLGPARRRSATVNVPMLRVTASDASDARASDSDSDEAAYALSDQEGVYGNSDHGWDRRLVEALGHSARHGHQALTPTSSSSNASDSDSDTEDGTRPATPPCNRSSIWTAIHTVRGAAAAAAAAGNGAALSSEDEQSPPAHPVKARSSAPASLVSSPQFPNTPSTGTFGAMRRPDADVSPARAPSAQPAAAVDEVPPFGALPAAIAPIVDVSIWPTEPALLQQEFPPRPLLFNLARFISIASSAYGQRFMQVIGMDSGMIDARALIDAFGDLDPLDTAPAGLSLSGSAVSIHTPEPPVGLAMPPLERLPSSSHRMPPPHGASPRRTARASRPGTPRRQLHPRHAHGHRRPVAEHPNHFCFAQHAGIPLSDLLFSSYVSPIVPGVTKAASARASAVERRLRHKRSLSTAAAAAQTKKPPQPSPPADAPCAVRSWLAAVPVLGSLYQSMPSPMGALSYVPVIPGMISRTLGIGAAPAAAADGDAPPAGDTPRAPREPTVGQFRRFDRIRRRLVYRNPSIHALVHYIAVDHATRSVVLACRGTLGISDLFIDMLCEYETVRLPGHAAAMSEPAELRAHSGMWHSALLLADPSSEVFREVAEALRLYPEYGLVITGHSLGGGVASLLTLLWSQPLFATAADPPGPARTLPASLAGGTRRFVTTDRFGLVTPRPIHCFSYGSPCSTNAALSYYCRGLVTSVANTDDFVSFLSVGAFVDILSISAVLGRERGVAEKVMRGFLAAQRAKISKRFRLFDFDFSKLRAYDPDPDPDSDGGSGPESTGSTAGSRKRSSSEGDATRSQQRRWWDYKTSQSNNTRGTGNSSPLPSPGAATPPADGTSKAKAKQGSLDDWYLSLVKTLRASMDSEKLYPPGDVFILASPGDDEVADKQLPLAAGAGTGAAAAAGHAKPAPADDGPLPVGLLYCPDVAARFSELRFTRNMIAHHLPSTYERRLSALVHDMYRQP